MQKLHLMRQNQSVKVEVDSGSPVYEVEKFWYDPIILIYQKPSYLLESTSHDYYMNGGSSTNY